MATEVFVLGYVHTIADSFSFRHQKLSAMVWIPFLYVTLHFRDRRDAASLRHKNRAKITVMSEQKQYHGMVFMPAQNLSGIAWT